MEVLGLTTFLLSWESTSLLFLKSQIKKLKTVISDSDSLICGVGQNGGIWMWYSVIVNKEEMQQGLQRM